MGADTQALVNATDEMDLGEYPEGYDPKLTCTEVTFMQDKYLLEQLSLLTDRRASEASREDALRWIAMPLVPGRLVLDLGPLSFQRCCIEAHGADPATLQERVLRRIAPERLAALGYE